MPEEEKKTVPIDTSGPDATVDIEETKDESVIETESPEQEIVEQETVIVNKFEYKIHYVVPIIIVVLVFMVFIVNY